MRVSSAMSQLCMFAALLYSFIGVAVAFKLSSTSSSSIFSTTSSNRPQHTQLSMGKFSNEIVVVGEVNQGLTEGIISSLTTLCPPTTTLTAVFNGRPTASKLKGLNPELSKIYADESVLESESELLSLKDKIVVLVHEVEEDIRGQDTPRSKSEEMVGKIANLIKKRGADQMPTSVVIATSVQSLLENKAEGPAILLSVFQRGSIRQSVAAIKSVSEDLPVSLLTYGSLLDQPDVPFDGPPLLEPKLVSLEVLG
jgi:hypothetical protein